MNNVTRFNLIEDGHIIFTGTEREVQKRVGFCPNTRLSLYVRNKMMIAKRFYVEYAEFVSKTYNYNFYENGILIFTGTSEDFKRKFQLKFKGSASAYANSHSKLLNRYDVEIVGQDRKDIQKKNAKVEYLAKHLERWHNCYIKDNPRPYLEDLLERGYDCTFRPCVAMKGFVVEAI